MSPLFALAAVAAAGNTPENRDGPPVAKPFPRHARLTRPRDFKRVFQQPLSSGDRYFKVLARHGDGAGPRLGMAVSRKVERRASVRNRIKRVIRESFRLRFAGSGTQAGRRPTLDFVVLPRPACATISNAEMFHSLDRHWARLVAQFERARPSDPKANGDTADEQESLDTHP